MTTINTPKTGWCIWWAWARKRPVTQGLEKVYISGPDKEYIRAWLYTNNYDFDHKIHKAK